MYIIFVLGNCSGLNSLADKAVADEWEFTVRTCGVHYSLVQKCSAGTVHSQICLRTLVIVEMVV